MIRRAAGVERWEVHQPACGTGWPPISQGLELGILDPVPPRFGMWSAPQRLRWKRMRKHGGKQSFYLLLISFNDLQSCFRIIFIVIVSTLYRVVHMESSYLACMACQGQRVHHRAHVGSDARHACGSAIRRFKGLHRWDDIEVDQVSGSWKRAYAHVLPRRSTVNTSHISPRWFEVALLGRSGSVAPCPGGHGASGDSVVGSKAMWPRPGRWMPCGSARWSRCAVACCCWRAACGPWRIGRLGLRHALLGGGRPSCCEAES